MNNFQDSTLPLSLIPKRPSRQTLRPVSYQKRLMIQPFVSPPISMGNAEQSVQLLAHLNHSSKERDEVNNRSLLSDMATIKSEALKLREPLEIKKKVISYPAVVNVRRPGKASFLSKVTTFLFKSKDAEQYT